MTTLRTELIEVLKTALFTTQLSLCEENNKHIQNDLMFVISKLSDYSNIDREREVVRT